MNHKIKSWLAVLAAAAAVIACGGGSESGVGSGGTGATASGAFNSGTVTGFGSVIIDGTRYDDSAATIEIERNPGSPATGTNASVKLGMHVETEHGDDDHIKTLSIQAELIAKISSVAADGFVAAGQNVLVSADPANPTVFEGANSLADLAVGDVVEVHGSRDATGAIVATRIERCDPSATPLVRVVGTLSGLNATAKTFSIGGLTVDYSAAALLPTGVTLAEGLRVAVWSDAAVVGDTLVAKVVRVKDRKLLNGLRVHLGGLVQDLDTAAVSFRIHGILVTASSARFVNGTLADLANGRAVRVSGKVTANGVSASEVKFVVDHGDANVELSGAITDFVSLASFKVRGVPVDASVAELSGGTAANLANGVLVRIEGEVDGGVVKASELHFVTTPDGGQRTFPGLVADFEPSSGLFRLAGFNVAMRITDSTRFSNADGSDATVADFNNGDRVLVRGDFAAGVLVVAQVKFVPDADHGLKLEGLLYALDSAATRFYLNGVEVDWGGATVFEGGTVNDLANGVKVEVTGTRTGNKVLASKIEIKRTALPAVAEVRGAVTDYVGVSDFRVAGQKVNASSAVFKDGAASQLANGHIVEVHGALVDGVLMATMVDFDD